MDNVLLKELDRQLNELAHNIGMERQHKKLIKQLLVNTSQASYHDGYDEGYKDAVDDDRNTQRNTLEFQKMKENAE